jgi:hypothetical protein
MIPAKFSSTKAIMAHGVYLEPLLAMTLRSTHNLQPSLRIHYLKVILIAPHNNGILFAPPHHGAKLAAMDHLNE